MRAIPKIAITKAVDDDGAFSLRPTADEITSAEALDATAILAMVWSTLEQKHHEVGSFSWPIREIATSFEADWLWLEFVPRPNKVKEARETVKKHFQDAIKSFITQYRTATAPAATEPLPFEIDHVERTKPATAAPATMKEATR